MGNPSKTLDQRPSLTLARYVWSRHPLGLPDRTFERDRDRRFGRRLPRLLAAGPIITMTKLANNQFPRWWCVTCVRWSPTLRGHWGHDLVARHSGGLDLARAAKEPSP